MCYQLSGMYVCDRYASRASTSSPTGAGVPVTSSRLYTAGGTDDFRQALMYLSKRFPNAPLLGVGYSLGANIITRYAAEEGKNCRLAAACIMANVGSAVHLNMMLYAHSQ
jgi:predicted alpha/beta-fold hydrolase